MSCRGLNGNFITLIPADAFTNLTQLQLLFVVCEWVTVGYMAVYNESIVGTD